MPYKSIADAKTAGFPTTADGIDLSLSQVNRLAAIYDAIKKTGSADNPMAAAWSQWKKLFKKQGDAWIENSDIQSIPENKVAAIFSLPSTLSFTDDPATGDTIFHDVTLIAEGTWTDGYSRTPTHYSANELKKMQFNKMTVKMSHDIFSQQPIINEIGIIENQQFKQDTPARWIGDVRIFPTQNGRDTATLLKRNKITDISSEIFLTPVQDKQNKRILGTDLVFEGAAVVRTGACKICKFNEGEIMTEDKTPMVPTENQVAEVSALEAQLSESAQADLKTLETQLEEAKKLNVSKVAAELFGAQQRIAQLEADNAALSRKVAELEHGSKVRELQLQIKELNKQPVIHTRIETPQRMIAVELDNEEFPAIFASDME